MERDRLNLKFLRKVFTIFIVLILGGTWLAEFFFSGHYEDPIYSYFQFWFYIVTPIVLWVIYLRLVSSSRKNMGRLELNDIRRIKAFKAVARVIKVNFDDCEVSHKEYKKEVILRKDTRYQERKIVRYSECQIKYINLEDGVPVLYKSPILYMEIINLRYKLHEQKSTLLYVDHKDSKRFVCENGKTYASDDEGSPYYYFDLEFLGDAVLIVPKAED